MPFSKAATASETPRGSLSMVFLIVELKMVATTNVCGNRQMHSSRRSHAAPCVPDLTKLCRWGTRKKRVLQSNARPFEIRHIARNKRQIVNKGNGCDLLVELVLRMWGPQSTP